MSSGAPLTIDCARLTPSSPLKVRTVTRDTVPKTDCDVDDSTVAKQVVKIQRQRTGPKIKVHIRIDTGGTQLVLTDPNRNNRQDVEWERNREVGVHTETCEFYLCKRQQNATGKQKITIEIWHSGSKVIADDADRSSLPSYVTRWGDLTPKIRLV